MDGPIAYCSNRLVINGKLLVPTHYPLYLHPVEYVIIT